MKFLPILGFAVLAFASTAHGQAPDPNDGESASQAVDLDLTKTPLDDTDQIVADGSTGSGQSETSEESGSEVSNSGMNSMLGSNEESSGSEIASEQGSDSDAAMGRITSAAVSIATAATFFL